jgi:hypothetical protein
MATSPTIAQVANTNRRLRLVTLEKMTRFDYNGDLVVELYEVYRDQTHPYEWFYKLRDSTTAKKYTAEIAAEVTATWAKMDPEERDTISANM